VFVGTLMNTGYMFLMIMATELVVGALLLANRFVVLALLLIARPSSSIASRSTSRDQSSKPTFAPMWQRH